MWKHSSWPFISSSNERLSADRMRIDCPGSTRCNTTLNCPIKLWPRDLLLLLQSRVYSGSRRLVILHSPNQDTERRDRYFVNEKSFVIQSMRPPSSQRVVVTFDSNAQLVCVLWGMMIRISMSIQVAVGVVAVSRVWHCPIIHPPLLLNGAVWWRNLKGDSLMIGSPTVSLSYKGRNREKVG